MQSIARRTLALIPLLALALVGCESQPASDSSEVSGSLIHLAELHNAEIESASATPREPIAWQLADGTDWQQMDSQYVPYLATVALESVSDGTRIALSRPPQQRGPLFIGGLRVDLDGLTFADWETVLVKARANERFAGMTVAYNLDDDDALPPFMHFFASPDRSPPIFSDGSTQTYAIPLMAREGQQAPETLRSLGVLFGAPGAAAIDVLEITLVPRGAGFPEPVAARTVARDDQARTTLYAHAPAKISWPLEVADGDRLNVGLTVNRGETVTYRVSAAAGDSTQELFSATVDDATVWQQEAIDLTPAAGADRLVLEMESEQSGVVGLLGAPIISRRQVVDDRPNVIFYVIDGGDADLMSLFGYDRPTTPFLEELAAESVVFTRAFSNATWTQPSTVSFMTSLQHSVLGGLSRGVHSTAVPPQATTMAEHFRHAGYQTISLTANPNAGRMVGLDKGVDLIADAEPENHSTASTLLEDEYWEFREQYSGGPTWAHFQTTDVHEPNHPEEPFKGTFVSDEEVAQLNQWDQAIWRTPAAAKFGQTSIIDFYEHAIAAIDAPRAEYFGTRKGLYDETMLYQDHSLEEFVVELKRRGEWENTILVIASDHGHPAGTYSRFGRGLMDPQPPQWEGAMFDAYATRIPLIVAWPAEIEGGRVIDTPVSMIDVLPTLLDLVGLPQPEVLQGQSLEPLLRGEEMEVRPVILDEFRVDEATGEMIGNLEIVDGKWGASLEIGPTPEGGDSRKGRHAVPAGGRWGAVHPYFPDTPRLLLYDLEADPFATQAVNDEHPDLVAKYERMLVEQWRAHQALATQFEAGEGEALSPEQLEQLQALGYIQ